MKAATSWRTAALAGGALLAGTFIGQPVVQAATAGLVTIQGGTSTNKAAVTKAGQLETTEASASSLVSVLGHPTCSGDGFYTVPAGKALIVTAVNFYDHNQAQSGSVESDLFAGPVATPCSTLLTAGISTTDIVLNQTFQPGIAVPGGDALGNETLNDAGSVQIYGYLVPKTDVPANALRQLPRAKAGQPATVIRRG